MAKKEIPAPLSGICSNTISYISVHCNSIILDIGAESPRLIFDSSFLLSILHLFIKKSCCLNLESRHGLWSMHTTSTATTLAQANILSYLDIQNSLYGGLFAKMAATIPLAVSYPIAIWLYSFSNQDVESLPQPFSLWKPHDLLQLV